MKKKVVIVIVFSVLLVPLLILNTVHQASASVKVETNMTEIMKNIDIAAKNNPEAAMSSNPYDYTANNPYFDNIVDLGSVALPAIRQKIKNSSNNGLEEYILAIAAEKIAKVDLKDDQSLWTTAKEWVTQWDNHLKTVEHNVDKITSSADTDEEKTKQLVKLGTPAIPFIMDKIENGQIEAAPALEILLTGNASVNDELGKITNWQIWAKENKDNFDDLRSLVEEANTNE